jgi:DHA1 family tetracycline resistance protein-like MFS transporter
MQGAGNVMIFLAICLALQMTSFVMIMPLFARRFSDFGAGVEALGLSSMAYALTSTIAAPFMGTLADRFGRRPLVLGSLAVYVFTFCGYLFAGSAGTFILLRGLAGVFTAGLIPAVTSIVADLAPEDRRAQWIGIVNGGASFGWIAGPVLGGLLYDRWDYVVPFMAAIGMAVVTLLTAFLFVPETRQRSLMGVCKEPQQLPAKSLPASFKTLKDSLPRSISTLPVLLTISFVVMFAWAFIEPQFMFYAYDNLQWTSSQLGLTMSTYGIALMVGEFTLGHLSDRLGRKPVLVMGLGLFSAQFIGLAFFHNTAGIVLSFILAGLGNALFDPALSAHILDITPAEHKGRMLGIKSTAGSIGNLLGPALVVLFSSRVSPQSIFLVAALLVILLTLASSLMLKRPQPAISR